MADRIMKVGDTYPPLKGFASDESGVLNLTGFPLEMIAIGPSHTITGAASAIWPAEVDGEDSWNWVYDLVVGDTDIAGDYNVYLRVTWATGEIETFPNDGSATLTIEPVD